MHSGQVNKGWILGRQALGRSTQQFVSQWEGLGSGDSTPQLSARCGADKPRRSLSQRQSRSQAAVQLPQFLQPQHPWPPKPQPTPHHRLVLDQGGTQQRKGCDPGLLLSGTTDADTGGAELLCDYTGLTCFNNHLLGERAWLNLTLRASTPEAGEQTPPWQDGDSHGAKRKPPPNIQHRVWTPQHQPHPLYQGVSCQHALRRDMAGIHTKTSLCAKKHCTCSLHRDAPT